MMGRLEEPNEYLRNYVKLISGALQRTITLAEFEKRYLAMFKAERQPLPDPIYEILNGLFTDLDRFTAETKLKDELSINQEEFCSALESASVELNNFIEHANG